MYKKDIINFLFLVSFPVFGIGNYISSAINPAAGYIVSTMPHVLIILFYLIDILYRRNFKLKINGTYVLMMLFILSGVGSLFLSVYKHFPGITPYVALGRSMVVFFPFQAFIILQLYNDKSEEGLLTRLTFISLTLLLLINLIGFYGLGLSNEGHSLGGQLSLPFFPGLYSGASVIGIICLILVVQLKTMRNMSIKVIWWRIIYLFIGLAIFYQINSRLVTMVLLIVLLLVFFNGIKNKLVFWASIFTIPLLLNFRILLYNILSLPVFEQIMRRIDFDDVTTFHGRAYLWERGLEWLLEDHRGLLFGNGYQGQYFLGILSDYARLWNPKTPHLMHFHSTSMEVLVNQGLFGFVILMILIYRLFVHYIKRYRYQNEDGVFLVVIVFCMLLLQIDTFVYIVGGMGFVIFSLLTSKIAVNLSPETQEVPDRKGDVVTLIQGQV